MDVLLRALIESKIRNLAGNSAISSRMFRPLIGALETSRKILALTAETGALLSETKMSTDPPLVTRDGVEILGAREEARTRFTLAIADENRGPVYSVGVEKEIVTGPPTAILANVKSALTVTSCVTFQFA
jgi:hypothetical protein